MGYAVIMFGVLLVMSLVVATAYNYGIAKESQIAPLKAKNIYAERETEKAQTDLVVAATKINGTAIYTSVDKSPNLLNLHLTIKNNGSIVLNPNKYSILLNRSWIWINSTSDNVTPPLLNSTTSSLNLSVTPSSAPMQSLSLLVVAGNGIKTITPTSPILYYVDINNNGTWWDANLSWLPSYGEDWQYII